MNDTTRKAPLRSLTGTPIETLYGARYLPAGTRTVVTASADNLYYYKCFIGAHTIQVEFGDCVFFLGHDRTTAFLRRGPCKVESEHIASIVRGYMPENRSSTVMNRTVLPYVNGCSTKQVFPPDRLGDPTLQLLDMPPFTSEQQHHIHSTARVVYVQAGRGHSIVGMDTAFATTELTPGMVCILEPMCPHHFTTEAERLIVLPLHIFSSVHGLEHQHPMFNGTHRV